MRKPVCKWISRDPDGRPSCEHGHARKRGDGWVCSKGADEAQRRYRATDKGRQAVYRDNHRPERVAAQRRYAKTPYAKSSKALYELTRVTF